MSTVSRIEWTDTTWNPVVGCAKVSEGCRNCYAMKEAHRLAGNPNAKVAAAYEGLTRNVPGKGPQWTGRVRCLPERLGHPLQWRKPRRVFVNSMSDLFHPNVPDTFIAEVFGVMAVAGETFSCGKEVRIRRAGHTEIKLANSTKYGPHTFQLLTKRPQRAADLLGSTAFRAAVASHAFRWAHNRRDAGYLQHQIDTREEWGRCYPPGRLWPLPNVWLGTSVENQEAADERIPHLLRTPAAVRWLSCEPLLGPVDVSRAHLHGPVPSEIDWVVIGGESGRGARPFDVSWARDLIGECRAARVPVFVKQLGSRPYGGEYCIDCDDEAAPCYSLRECPCSCHEVERLLDRKGGDPSEWPEDLRVREWPR